MIFHRRLVEELEQVFASEEFDATDVCLRAYDNPSLMDAVEDAVPKARDRSGRLKPDAVRRVLKKLNGVKTHCGIKYKVWTFQIGGDGA